MEGEISVGSKMKTKREDEWGRTQGGKGVAGRCTETEVVQTVCRRRPMHSQWGSHGMAPVMAVLKADLCQGKRVGGF